MNIKRFKHRTMACLPGGRAASIKDRPVGGGEATIATMGAWSVDQLATQILARPLARTTAGPLLARAATALHRDLQCENEYTAPLLQELATGQAMVLRIAHQPNLFPYEQLIAQTLYLADTATEIKQAGWPVVAMVFVVDYDVCGDDCIKEARAFDPSVSNELRKFSHLVSRTDEEIPAYLRPAPSDQVRHIIEVRLGQLARGRGGSPAYLAEHSGVARPARSLADFNLFAWANLAVRLWNLPLLFVRLSDLAQQFEPERQALARRVADEIGEAPERLLWSICRRCNQRVGFNRPCCPGGHLDWSPPRVLVDDLSDYVLYGVGGGTGHAAGSKPLNEQHLYQAHSVGARLGIELPPESCWRLSADSLSGTRAFTTASTPAARAFIQKGRNSLVAHLVDEERAMAFLTESRTTMRASFG